MKIKQIQKINIIELFALIPDPRRENHNTKLHELTDIIAIAVIATLCGMTSWVDIVDFALAHKKWFKKILSLPNGIPSPDTFGRVFSILNPQGFEQCFFTWVRTLVTLKKDTIIALDGKSVRASKHRAEKPLHLVNAFAVESGIVLGQKKVDGKSNEITAVPELLDLLFLKGCIITADAMATQAAIVKKILANKGDYVLALKGNQGRVLRDSVALFADVTPDTTIATYAVTLDKDHGRIGSRECFVVTDLRNLRDKDRWDGLCSVVKIVSKRTIQNTTTTETRYYISSLAYPAKKFLHIIRSHWAIENSLHWVLDVVFKEDESRVRLGHAAENLAYLRKIALNTVRKDTEHKISLRRKLHKAAWDNVYLESLLGLA